MTLYLRHRDLITLEGIDLTGITQLDCSFNRLTFLPTLPSTLRVLRCSDNLLITLDAKTLPSNLRILDCSYNQLTSLNELPSNLQILNCSYNQLISLNAKALPSSLKILSCLHNQLTTLPKLPTSLEVLGCANNQLTLLPILPNLKDLYCDNNQLKTLPMLPLTIEKLYCSNNQLLSLPPLPSTLKELWCSNNQLMTCPTLPFNLMILTYDQGYSEKNNKDITMIKLEQHNKKRIKLGLSNVETLPSKKEWDDVNSQYILLQYEPGGEMYNDCKKQINELY